MSLESCIMTALFIHVAGHHSYFYCWILLEQCSCALVAVERNFGVSLFSGAAQGPDAPV